MTNYRQLTLFGSPQEVKNTRTPTKNIAESAKKAYCVYEHIFPNGKRYIGISCQVSKRWRDGKGYELQSKMAHAIKRYGWDNIVHNIIADGLTKEQAACLEKYLIAQLHTIDNGYNVSVGGEKLKGTYLTSYVLGMAHTAKLDGCVMKIVFDDGEMNLPEYVYSIRYDKDASEFWNEASRAVLIKHGKFSFTDKLACAEYWYHMAQYFSLHIDMKLGKDVSLWREESYDQFKYNAVFGSAVG